MGSWSIWDLWSVFVFRSTSSTSGPNWWGTSTAHWSPHFWMDYGLKLICHISMSIWLECLDITLWFWHGVLMFSGLCWCWCTTSVALHHGHNATKLRDMQVTCHLIFRSNWSLKTGFWSENMRVSRRPACYWLVKVWQIQNIYMILCNKKSM